MSGGKGGRLGWYVRRLASMSPAEIAHRFVERGKQYADTRRTFGWSAFEPGGAFAFDGEVGPLPGLRADTAAACMSPEVERHARAVLAGEMMFLSARWPKPAQADWWRGDTWSLDPVSGQHWPGRDAAASKSAYRHASGRGDVKFVWELNRLQFLMPLAAAARRDNDVALARTIDDVLAGWMQANPPYQGVNWTNGIEFATRVMVVLFAHSVLGALAPETFRARLRPFLAAHVRMLARYPSLFSSANNHRVAELAALYVALKCAPRLPRTLAPDHRAGRELEDEILKQFHADGVGAEQSPTYAAYSLEWFLLAALCAEGAGAAFSDAYRTRLSLASAHLRWLIDDSGATPAIGDDDEGRVVALGPPQDYRYPAAVCASSARWLKEAHNAPPPQPPTLLDAFIAGAAADKAPDALSGQRTFVDGGYSVWRTPTRHGTLLLAFDHAPLGFLSIAAHGHADALSVWLHLGAQPVIVDAGTYLYHTDSNDRDEFRGTLAHNTLALAGENQSRIAGPFNWADHAKASAQINGDAIVGEHDGYVATHGVRHQRSVSLEGQSAVIIDALAGVLIAPTPWSAGYTFHPDVVLALNGDGVDATLPNGARLHVRVHFAGDGQLSLTEARVSLGFGRAAPTKRLLFSGNAAQAGSLATTTIDILD